MLLSRISKANSYYNNDNPRDKEIGASKLALTNFGYGDGAVEIEASVQFSNRKRPILLRKPVMPFPTKIQPVDFSIPEETRYEPVKPIAKSRFKRLFERQFPNALRISNSEKIGYVVEDAHRNKDVLAGEFDPSSVCLAKMVRNFIEESNEKQSITNCARHRCNCFSVSNSDNSDDDFDSYFGDSNFSSSSEACEILKSLVLSSSVAEKNLLLDVTKIVENDKFCKRKDNHSRKIVADGLIALGYEASICKSRWEKSPSHPAGEYDYVDAIVGSERFIIDIDFRSEFEIARSTKTYKTILQILPQIYVGKSDRLQMIISILSEAAKQSLKKKGMPLPPWRTAGYVKAKWLSPNQKQPIESVLPKPIESDKKDGLIHSSTSSGEFELVSSENLSAIEEEENGAVFSLSVSSGEEEKILVVKRQDPPAIRSKSSLIGNKLTGLASLFGEKP